MDDSHNDRSLHWLQFQTRINQASSLLSGQLDVSPTQVSPWHPPQIHISQASQPASILNRTVFTLASQPNIHQPSFRITRPVCRTQKVVIFGRNRRCVSIRPLRETHTAREDSRQPAYTKKKNTTKLEPAGQADRHTDRGRLSDIAKQRRTQTKSLSTEKSRQSTAVHKRRQTDGQREREGQTDTQRDRPGY